MKRAFHAVMNGITRLGTLWLASVVFAHTGIDVTKESRGQDR
jgi:hypothetical protein